MSQRKPRKPFEDLAFPMMDSPEAINAADWLSDAEKEMAIGNIDKIARSDGFWLLNNHPELARTFFGLGYQIFAACGDGPVVPGKAGQVLHMEVARLLNCEFLLGTMNSAAAKQAVSGFHPMMIGMVSEPDSPMWSEEQRMGIKFARALVQNNLTPELREEAIEMWGPQGVLAYTALTAWAWFWSTMTNALGLKWEHGASDQLENIGGSDIVEASKFFGTHVKAMKKYWDEAKPFGK